MVRTSGQSLPWSRTTFRPNHGYVTAWREPHIDYLKGRRATIRQLQEADATALQSGGVQKYPGIQV